MKYSTAPGKILELLFFPIKYEMSPRLCHQGSQCPGWLTRRCSTNSRDRLGLAGRIKFDIIGNKKAHLNGFLWGVEDNWVVGPESMVGLKGKTQLFDDLNPLKAFLFHFYFDQCINKVFCGQTFPGLLFSPANLFTLLVFPLLFLPHRHFHFTSREIEKLNVLMKVKVFLIFAKTLPFKNNFFAN